MKKLLFTFLFSSLMCVVLYAEDTPAVPAPEADAKSDVTVNLEPKAKDADKNQAQKPSSFNMGGQMGAVVLTDEKGNPKVYYQISLQPEFRFWRIGTKLDLVIYFDEKNNLKEGEWNEDKLIEKIIYVEFNSENDVLNRNAKLIDRFYGYLGGFPSFTFGHGLLMSRYTNMLSWPDVKKIGARFKFDYTTCGISLFSNNLNIAEILGGRAFVRPFMMGKVDKMNLERLSMGISLVSDVDPDNNASTKDDAVTGMSFDLDYPVIDKSLFSMTLFYDIAQLNLGDAYTVNDSTKYPNISAYYTMTGAARPKSGGMGMTYGAMGTLAKLFNYRGEFRDMDYNFIPGYFDYFYDDARKYDLRYSSMPTLSKAFLVPSAIAPKLQGYFANLGADIMGKIKVSASWEDVMNIPSPGLYPWLHAEMSVDKSLLMNKYSLNFKYDKRGADSWKKVTETDKDAVLMTELGYSMSSNVSVVIVYRTIYDKNGNPQTSTNMQMNMSF